MSGYGAREVAKMLSLSLGQVRAYVRAGFLDPTRGPRGQLLFSFQDLVLLRTAQGLVSARIAPRRVRSALRKLKEQLPQGRPLRGVHIRAEGDRIVVGDDRASWSPESGHVLLDFETKELARKVAPLQIRARGGDASDWYERACDLEETAPDEDRKSTRLNSSHGYISYAVFCLKKKRRDQPGQPRRAGFLRPVPEILQTRPDRRNGRRV